MNILFKALLIGGLITAGLMAVIAFIIPIMAFLIISSIISLIAYAVIKENQEERQEGKHVRPPP